MGKIVEFENVYIELPENYVLESEETKTDAVEEVVTEEVAKEEVVAEETVINVQEPTIELIPEDEEEEELVEAPTIEETEEVEEVVEETPEEEPVEEEVVEEIKEQPIHPGIRIELPVQDKIVENALKDIEAAEKEEDPAVTKQATTKLSFEELQKRLEETQALHL